MSLILGLLLIAFVYSEEPNPSAVARENLILEEIKQTGEYKPGEYDSLFALFAKDKYNLEVNTNGIESVSYKEDGTLTNNGCSINMNDWANTGIKITALKDGGFDIGGKIYANVGSIKYDKETKEKTMTFAFSDIGKTALLGNENTMLNFNREPRENEVLKYDITTNGVTKIKSYGDYGTYSIQKETNTKSLNPFIRVYFDGETTIKENSDSSYDVKGGFIKATDVDGYSTGLIDTNDQNVQINLNNNIISALLPKSSRAYQYNDVSLSQLDTIIENPNNAPLNIAFNTKDENVPGSDITLGGKTIFANFNTKGESARIIDPRGAIFNVDSRGLNRKVLPNKNEVLPTLKDYTSFYGIRRSLLARDSPLNPSEFEDYAIVSNGHKIDLKHDKAHDTWVALKDKSVIDTFNQERDIYERLNEEAKQEPWGFMTSRSPKDEAKFRLDSVRFYFQR